MHLWIGTSGFQYPEWKGTFYPEDLPLRKMLSHYADQFSSTESNYTFRRLPKSAVVERWASETPDHFRFSFKAPQRVTHFAKLQNTAQLVRAFWKVISVAGPKAGAVLFQLPPTFEADLKRLRSFLKSLPAGMRAAFEFRHPSWFCDEVFDALRAHGSALCIAESEELLTPSVVTSDFGYLRLRREDYSPARLKKWAAFVTSKSDAWKEVFVYFKHEEKALGPKFARQMIKALGAPGPRKARRAPRSS